MKKFVFGILMGCLLSAELFAMKAVVVCRTGGIIHKSSSKIF